MNTGIYIYDDAEVLDFSGPFEVFSVASRFLDKDKKFNVFLVSQSMKPVIARGGYSINTSYDFTNHPSIDTLIVVGGLHTNEVKKIEVIQWIKDVAKTASIKASVCTGAFLFAQAKVITTHKVTTHWEDIADLKKDFPSLDVVSGVRWVDLGDIITSAGISAGIDMSLQIVAKLVNEELAIKTAKQMDFDWRKNK